MYARRRILFLILIMALVVVGVSATSLVLLYRAAFDGQKARLRETAQSQARLLEAIARNEVEHSQDSPGGSEAVILDQMRDAHTRYQSGSRTGELTLARREGADIVFLLSHRQGDEETPQPVPLASSRAEPMRRALAGQSGTMIGMDYHGATVLAAYEPVAGLGWGLVAKVDLIEIQSPFLQAAAISALCALILVCLGALLFIRLTNPLLEHLQEGERRFRLLFEGMLDGFALHEILCDQEGQPYDYRFLEANPAFEKLTGLKAADITGRTVREVLPAIESSWIETYGRVALTGEPAHFENHSRDLDRYYEVTAFSPMRGQFAAVFVDVTAHRRAEEAIRQLNAELEQRVQERTAELQATNVALQGEIAERQQMQTKLLAAERLAALGALSGGIAHEIRNPLGTIDSSIYYLKVRLKDADDKTRTHLERMKGAVDHALAVIESLLNLTRSKEPQVSRLDLAVAVTEALAASHVPPEVQVVQHTPPGLVIEADPGQIGIALRNIFVNAVEAMSGNGTLTVAAQELAEGLVELTVTDSGPGISREHLERIFEPLHTTKVKGFGFGLAIVKQIIERHGGTVVAQSEPGQGATMLIHLPLARKQAEA